jgi:hypothetical protein
MAENSVFHQLDIGKFLASDLEEVNVVLPGDLITTSQGFMQ